MSMLRELAERFEQASQQYAAHHDIVRDEDWFVLKLQEELGELAQAWIKLTHRGRPGSATAEDLKQALADETADLLGHVLLFAYQHDLDLSEAVRRKWRFDVAE